MTYCQVLYVIDTQKRRPPTVEGRRMRSLIQKTDRPGGRVSYVVGCLLPLPSTPCISSTTKSMPTTMDDSLSAPAAANTSSTSPTHPPDGAVASPMVAPTKPRASDGDARKRLDSPSHMMTPKTLSFLGNSPNFNTPAAPPAASPVAGVSYVPRPLGFPSFICVPASFK